MRLNAADSVSIRSDARRRASNRMMLPGLCMAQIKVGQTVTFTQASNVAVPVAFLWTFGDNQTDSTSWPTVSIFCDCASLASA